MTKNLFFLSTALLLTLMGHGQETARFEVSSNAKLVSSWSGEDTQNASGTLANGDKIIVTTNEVEILVELIHDEERTTLLVTGEQDAMETTELKVYEYDFDQNGDKELLVVDSPDFSLAYVKVYNLSDGTVELVGNFFGQFYIDLDNNILSLPIGSQGLADEYIYLGGVFYTLHYHDPIIEDEE